MKRFIFGSFLAAFVFICAPISYAAAHVEFINTGTPTNGSVVMNGWYGVIVRVQLDEGPITRINFGGGTFGGYIRGNIAQRWTDPTGQRNYTQASPGPLTASNTFGSDLNFDSHFLGAPGMYTVASVTEFDARDFLTSRTGLISDGFVGYGASSYVHYEVDPIEFSQGGFLRGILDVDPAFQSKAIDAAYVVTDSAFQVDVDLTTTGGSIGIGGTFVLPEPGGIGLSLFGAITGLLWRRRMNSLKYRCNTLADTTRQKLVTRNGARIRRVGSLGARGAKSPPSVMRLNTTALVPLNAAASAAV